MKLLLQFLLVVAVSCDWGRKPGMGPGMGPVKGMVDGACPGLEKACSMEEGMDNKLKCAKSYVAPASEPHCSWLKTQLETYFQAVMQSDFMPAPWALPKRLKASACPKLDAACPCPSKGQVSFEEHQACVGNYTIPAADVHCQWTLDELKAEKMHQQGGSSGEHRPQGGMRGGEEDSSEERKPWMQHRQRGPWGMRGGEEDSSEERKPWMQHRQGGGFEHGPWGGMRGGEEGSKEQGMRGEEDSSEEQRGGQGTRGGEGDSEEHKPWGMRGEEDSSEEHKPWGMRGEEDSSEERKPWMRRGGFEHHWRHHKHHRDHREHSRHGGFEHKSWMQRKSQPQPWMHREPQPWMHRESQPDESSQPWMHRGEENAGKPWSREPEAKSGEAPSASSAAPFGH